MKIGIRRAKDDPLRLVLQVEELEQDMTMALLAVAHQMRVIVNPEPVGVNAVEFGLPEEIKEEDKREIKIALVNTARAILSDPQMVQNLMQQVHGVQLVAMPREALQGLMEELGSLRLQAGIGEAKVKALDTHLEEGKQIISNFLSLFKKQYKTIVTLAVVLGALGGLGVLNLIWRLF